jgi:hypothetical protein
VNVEILRIVGSPVEAGDIIELEENLGSPLPADYRNFLLCTNGVVLKPNVLTDNTNVGVQQFLALAKGADGLLAVRKAYEGRLPADLLPIAYAAGGNLICISILSGKVQFWDHEREAEEGQPPTTENLTLLSDSFDQFFDSLVPITEVAMPAVRVRSASFDPSKLKG